ncbi:unnamed protein product [Caenorhabditis auriculariae]|uniref:GPR180/TMEM145 transmembrane domain-containing protein n=1 Tax=Caenorhabditis auriculariae TaxID=2777116 RepID=A0A8S1GTK6_9PELO|nr:unnamed protein product [Caenorhabditis auriculariae]
MAGSGGNFTSCWFFSNSAHIQGKWNPREERALIVTKFGFQQTKIGDEKNTRGFLYGHVTTQAPYNYSSPVLLVLASKKSIAYFRSDSEYGMSCGSMLKNISKEGFESKCFSNGTSDVFRWVPCPQGHLCKDEDNASNVIPGYQMTLQVQESYSPEYWYVILLACKLNENCAWESSNPDLTIEYDLWLTNGRPNSKEASFFTFNFSFDEQNTVQILLITVIMYAFLAMLLSRVRAKTRHHALPPRTRLLSYIVTAKMVGSALQCINVLVYAYDGQGVFLARVAGEIIRVGCVEMMCLLLLMLARGWDITQSTEALNTNCLALWGFLALLDLFFFCCNFIFVYDTLHDVDVFSAWPGHGMIAIRIFYAMWFLIEIRRLIDREQNEEKAVFLANFGAGFLVWFISLPMIGIVVSLVSQQWRFSLILALTSLANFSALACLVHQFWPTSSYRKFYADYMSAHRRLSRTESHEMTEYELMLFYEESESENDYPDADSHLNVI